MGTDFKDGFLFFFDSNRKITHKVIAFLVLLFVLWFIDTALGFSSFSFTNKKIEAINNVYSVLNNPQIDSITKAKMKSELHNIVNSRSIKDRIYTSLTLFPEIKYPKAKIPMNSAGNIMIVDYSYFWLTLSSVGIIIALSIIGFFVSYKSIVSLLANIILAYFMIHFLFLVINGLPILTADKYWSNLYYQLLFIGFWFGIMLIIILVKKWVIKPII